MVINSEENHISSDFGVLNVVVSFFLFLCLALLAGLRELEVGIDTLTYSNEYMMATIGQPVFRGTEWLFTEILVFFSSIGIDFRGFLGVHGVFYFMSFFCLSYFLTRNSGFILFFLFVLVSGLLDFGFSGIRQTISMGMLLYAMFFLINGRFLVYFILGLSSFFIHNSSFIPFLLLILFIYLNINNLQFLILVIITPLFTLFNNDIIALFDFVDIKQLKAGYADETDFLNLKIPLLIWFLAILSSFCVYYRGFYIERKRIDRLLKWGTLAMLAFLWMAVSVRLFDRLAFYFMPFFGVYLSSSLGGLRKPLWLWLIFFGAFSVLAISVIYINRSFFLTAVV